MRHKTCPECGHSNPVQARFCMNCGTALAGQLAKGPVGNSASANRPDQGGTDWGAIVVAVLGFLSLWRASRRARQGTIVVVFLMLFFGCPMACGTTAFLVEAVTRLLGQG